MLMCSDLPTMCHHHYRTRNHPAIHGSCIPMVWTTHQGDKRQRPPLYLILWESTCCQTRHPAEPHNGIPPSNGWPIRKKEPMGRTIPPPSHVCATRRLDPVASNRNCSSQQSVEFHNWLITQSH